MSYVTPASAEIGRTTRIESMPGAPAPVLPNTSVWTWYCCACSRANQRPRESENYSICRSCQHERCRSCSIRWKNRTISQEYYKRAYDRTMGFANGKCTPKTYYRLKQEDEDEAAKHGLETMRGRNARLKREEEELWELAGTLAVEEEEAEKARLLEGSGVGGLGSSLGDSGLDSRESGTSEGSVHGEIGDVGSMVDILVI